MASFKAFRGLACCAPYGLWVVLTCNTRVLWSHLLGRLHLYEEVLPSHFDAWECQPNPTQTVQGVVCEDILHILISS